MAWTYRGIFNVNALKVETEGTPEMRARLKEGTLDVIFANPPFAGHEEENEFPVTLEEYREGDSRYLVPIRELSHRLDAQFHVPHNRSILRLFEENPCHRLVALQELGSFHTDKRNPRQTPEAWIDLIETSSVDPDTLVITPKRIRGAESNYTSLKVVRSGDLLISRRRAYRGAIVEVPPELDGALAIPEFSVLRLRPEFDRAYILEILRSQPFLDLMTIYSTGEMSGRIAEKDLRQLKIPLPDNHAEIGRQFTVLRARIAEWESRIRENKAAIANKVQEVLTGS